MERDIADIFAECLAATEEEGLTLDEYLAQHPEHVEVLQDLLPLALELQSMPGSVPSEAFRSDSYKQLMQEIKKESSWSVMFFDNLRIKSKNMC